MRAGPGAAGLGPSTGYWPQGPALLLLWCWVNSWQEQAGCPALAGLAVLTCPGSTNLGPSVVLQGLPSAAMKCFQRSCYSSLHLLLQYLARVSSTYLRWVFTQGP